METYFQNLIFTNHAIKRLYDRGIAQSDAWYTFKHADGVLPGKSPGAKKFYKTYGKQKIEVVAKKNEKGQWVILSCWSKYVGDGKPMFKKPSFLEKLIHKFLNRIFERKTIPEHSTSRVKSADTLEV